MPYEYVRYIARTHLVYDRADPDFIPFTIDDNGRELDRYSPDRFPSKTAFVRAHATEMFTSLPKPIVYEFPKYVDNGQPDYYDADHYKPRIIADADLALVQAVNETEAEIKQFKEERENREATEPVYQQDETTTIDDLKTIQIVETEPVYDRPMLSLDPTVYRTIEERLKYFVDNDRYFTNNDVTESRDNFLDGDEYVYPVFRISNKFGEYNILRGVYDTYYNKRYDAYFPLNKYETRLAARLIPDRVNRNINVDEWYIYAWYKVDATAGIIDIPPAPINNDQFQANKSGYKLLKEEYVVPVIDDIKEWLGEKTDQLGDAFGGLKEILYVMLFFGGIALIAYILTLLYLFFN